MAEPTDTPDVSTHTAVVVLSEDERAKVRALLFAGTPESASLAMSLLETLEAGPVDRLAVFDHALILKLVVSWNPQVWEVVFDDLPTPRRKIFMAFALLRFVAGAQERWGPMRDTNAGIWKWLNGWSPRGTELRAALKRHRRGDGYDFEQVSPWADLDFVDELDDAVANEIAAFKGDVHLNAVTGLTVSQAKILSNHVGWLYANGIASLDDDVAVELAKHPSHLFLEGLTTLSHVGLTKKLAAKSHVCLDSLLSITDEAAKALVRSGSRICAKHVEQQLAAHRLK